MAPLVHNDPITVVALYNSPRGRIIQTTVFDWRRFKKAPPHPPVGPTFEANEDDRVEHNLTDEGKTWVRGHVANDSPEAIAMLNAAGPALAGDGDSESSREERMLPPPRQPNPGDAEQF